MKVSTSQITETVAPTAEIFDVAVMRSHLSIMGDEHDETIYLQMRAARQYAENYLQKALVQRTYRADLWGFSDVMELPMPPLSSVSNIKYYNTDSPQTLTTLDSSVYGVDVGRGQIYRNHGESWPAVSIRHDAVQITFVTGYTSGNTPPSVDAAVKLIVGDLFENREGKIVSAIQSVNPTVKMLLNPEREY